MSRKTKVVKKDLQMAYNKKNLYKTMIRVQNKVLEMQALDGDMTLQEIYHNEINGKLVNICYRTFHSYISTNAKRELKKLLQDDQQKINSQNQLTLF